MYIRNVMYAFSCFNVFATLIVITLCHAIKNGCINKRESLSHRIFIDYRATLF